MEKGASYSIVDGVKQTPLHRASGAGVMRMVRFLLEHGADRVVNAQDVQGQTALHLACEEGHGEIARLLMDNGADSAVLDKQKRTPLDVCMPQLKQYLLRLSRE